MLSRTADHLFWMSRYTERAENTARMLNVVHETALLPQSAERAQEGWLGMLSISELIPAYTARHGTVTRDGVLHFMVRDGSNPSSILSCLRAARENARAVRGTLTSEVWETQNQTWLEVNRMLAEQYMGEGFLYGQDLTTEAGCRRTWAQYWGNITLVDRAVGEILGALHETGLAERTIVIFTSDHGDMMGDHGLFEKCVLYEEAVRVPLLVRVPWLGHGPRLIPGRISQIDLVPTLLDLLGEPIPAGLQGQSRSAVLRGEATLTGNDVFVEWNGPDGRPARFFDQGSAHLREPLDAATRQRAGEKWMAVQGAWRSVISADGWKLNLSATDQAELYDLDSDPHELRNRFDEPGQQGRVGELADRLRAWQAQTADHGFQ